MAAVAEIGAHAARRDPELAVVVGHPRPVPGGVRPLRNSATVWRGGRVLAVCDKRLLPGYDVFDEDRYFDPGTEPCVVELGGRRCGVAICEDLWMARDVAFARRYPVEPVRDLAAAGCGCILALNASPFVTGKWTRHLSQLSTVARDLGVPIVAVNQVGANDDLIFDGRSVVVDGAGRLVGRLPGWEAATRTVALAADAPAADSEADPSEEVVRALILGVRDYCRKSGQGNVLLGLSGGIDSALTAVIAASALGPGAVSGVFMPSRYSSAASREDARTLARRLGLGWFAEMPIEAMHRRMQSDLLEQLPAAAGGVVDENVQARLRAVVLMALSNGGHGLLLCTSNKSEMATGYTTLYGDLCGAVAVLGDVLKTQVYELARWINRHPAALGLPGPPIASRILTRPPSAELRPDQTDQDTLPPYDVLDEIVRRFVDQDQEPQGIIEATGLEAELVWRVTRMIDAAQFKRDQAPVVLKTSPRAFGRGRPMPIVMKAAGVPEPLAVPPG
jgi:NAD+ synthase/NAD+ synthase (glutamine-hydrolysing)